MNKVLLRLLLGLILFNGIFAQTIDSDKSYVKFTVRNMGVRDVVGTITGMQGTATVDMGKPDSSLFDVIDLKLQTY